MIIEGTTIVPNEGLTSQPFVVPDAAVGGGFAVLQRNSVGRLIARRCPYEWGSALEAVTEADRRAAERPGREFVVVEAIHSSKVAVPEVQ